MNGKLIVKTALAAGILLGAAAPAPRLWGNSVYAQTEASTIRIGLDNRNYVLGDGSLRAEGRTLGPAQETSPFVGLTRDTHTGDQYAWTENGSVYRWGTLGLTGQPKRLTDLPPIAQVSEDVMLAKSGEVVGYKGAGLPGAVKISAHASGFVLLTANGEIWRYRSDYQTNQTKKVADLPGTADIQAASSYIMALSADGTVTKLDAETGSDPETLTTGALSLAWVREESRSDLYVVKSDGSLWRFEYGSKSAGTQIAAVKGAAYVHAAEEGVFVRLNDGTSGLYANGRWTALAPARLQSAVLTLSRPSAAKGETIRPTVEEKYSDGTKSKRSPERSELSTADPKIAALQADGTIKAAGLGSTVVTFSSGALEAKATLTVKQEGALSGAGLIGGSAYLPVGPVFGALGASVTHSGGSWTIRYGDTKIGMQKGSAKASINGKPVTMKGKVQTLDGQAVFPASFLSSAIAGASVKWDGKLQQAVVSLGSASLEVESKETALLKKKQQLGSLASYLGKSYWINHYAGAGVRFGKLNVADIKIQDNGYGHSYTVVFANASGSRFAAPSTDASGVVSMLTDTANFFPFDPRARYGGSDEIWNYIRREVVAVGMNKQHVLLSWGEPSSVSKENSPNGPIEAWVYMRGGLQWQAVGFLNGVVVGIY
ncbi:stalk domain-containing protein [Saccharibacillus alkalitolerans]|uniref:Copper amine oxidase-like N-terminal domain-containing protein n=1 Tax=Saccharibacillus alkalitolerans TaxID=2705290 RepID=A0ABX0F192_9BACL|nr:stalk domain-containing protein [Saccharibacillus alkalitolerans]NGZ74188.1 hypothetical protein [Saccharibacillus alkalitolerans]